MSEMFVTFPRLIELTPTLGSEIKLTNEETTTTAQLAARVGIPLVGWGAPDSSSGRYGPEGRATMNVGLDTFETAFGAGVFGRHQIFTGETTPLVGLTAAIGGMSTGRFYTRLDVGLSESYLSMFEGGLSVGYEVGPGGDGAIDHFMTVGAYLTLTAF